MLGNHDCSYIICNKDPLSCSCTVFYGANKHEAKERGRKSIQTPCWNDFQTGDWELLPLVNWLRGRDSSGKSVELIVTSMLLRTTTLLPQLERRFKHGFRKKLYKSPRPRGDSHLATAINQLPSFRSNC